MPNTQNRQGDAPGVTPPMRNHIKLNGNTGRKPTTETTVRNPRKVPPAMVPPSRTGASRPVTAPWPQTAPQAVTGPDVAPVSPQAANNPTQGQTTTQFPPTPSPQFRAQPMPQAPQPTTPQTTPPEMWPAPVAQQPAQQPTQPQVAQQSAMWPQAEQQPVIMRPPVVQPEQQVPASQAIVAPESQSVPWQEQQPHEEGIKTGLGDPWKRVMAFVHAETGYARHPRTSPVWRWWRPILTGGLAFVYFVVLLGVLLFGGMLGGIYGQDDINMISNAASTNQGELFFSPVGALLVVGGLALMVPAIALALWTSRERPFGTLMSVFGRFRLGLFAKALAFAFVATSVPILIETLMAGGGSLPGIHPMEVSRFVIATLVVALPLQCLAEEVIFRGYVMQTVASWMPKKVAFPVAIVAQAVLFMMGHAYDLPGQLSILASGLIWGWVAEKTGGLETSTAFHVANNTMAFLVMGLGLASISNSIPVAEAIIDGTASILMPVLFVLLGTRRGWIGDEETLRAGHEPCRMFGSQRDALMWERIQQEQMEDWNRFISQMPEVGQNAQPDGYDGYIDGEGMVIGVGDAQYDDSQLVSVIDTGQYPAMGQPLQPAWQGDGTDPSQKGQTSQDAFREVAPVAQDGMVGLDSGWARPPASPAMWPQEAVPQDAAMGTPGQVAAQDWLPTQAPADAVGMHNQDAPDVRGHQGYSPADPIPDLESLL